MKIALLAAALVAAPAVAQDTTAVPGAPATTAQSAPMGQTPPMAQTPPTAQPAPTTDPMMNAPSTDAGATAQAPMGNSGFTPTQTPGGYQPSGSMPMATGGQPPVFTPGPSVSQAYPAPAPLASYPVCKKGQYDKCIQRGGR